MAGVLDASALLAYLQEEPGEEAVAAAMVEGLVISTVNLAEVLAKLTDGGADADEATDRLAGSGILGGTVRVEAFTETDALASARLRPLTTGASLSLGDRACLALAQRLGLAALTTDRAWERLSLDIPVHLVR